MPRVLNRCALRGRVFLLLFLLARPPALSAQTPPPDPPPDPPQKPLGVDWSRLLLQSLGFLGIQHGFRLATEEGTRNPGRSFWNGYSESLRNLRGWSDGDPFYVDYVGHPMQGAVSGYLFVQNDRQYRTSEFGRNRRYWKSRLRAAGFALAYSEQFELGPISEATIGHVQSFHPQFGFADHVITPSIGLAWMLAEDSLDRYLIRFVERRTANPYLRLLLRSGLNPSRSMANLIALRVPWHRDTRGGVFKPTASLLPASGPTPATNGVPERFPRFQFLATAIGEKYLGAGSHGACLGGGGSAAFRVTPHWYLVGEVTGCKLTGFGDNRSGDSLTYLVGPRWTPSPASRWQPWVQVLLGGRTITHEVIDPVKRALVEAAAAREKRTVAFADHYLYAQWFPRTGLAASVSAGLDLRLTSAITLRTADLSFRQSRNSRVGGIDYSQALGFSTGLVVNFGTW